MSDLAEGRTMETEHNKDVVRRFITEVLVGGQIDRIDELVAPNYVNRAFGVDLAAFKGMLAGRGRSARSSV